MHCSHARRGRCRGTAPRTLPPLGTSVAGVSASAQKAAHPSQEPGLGGWARHRPGSEVLGAGVRGRPATPGLGGGSREGRRHRSHLALSSVTRGEEAAQTQGGSPPLQTVLAKRLVVPVVPKPGRALFTGTGEGGVRVQNTEAVITLKRLSSRFSERRAETAGLPSGQCGGPGPCRGAQQPVVTGTLHGVGGPGRGHWDHSLVSGGPRGPATQLTALRSRPGGPSLGVFLLRPLLPHRPPGALPGGAGWAAGQVCAAAVGRSPARPRPTCRFSELRWRGPGEPLLSQEPSLQRGA